MLYVTDSPLQGSLIAGRHERLMNDTTHTDHMTTVFHTSTSIFLQILSLYIYIYIFSLYKYKKKKKYMKYRPTKHIFPC